MKIQVARKAPENWNQEIIEASLPGEFEQSSYWGDILFELSKAERIFLSASKDGIPQANLFLMRKRPWDVKKNCPRKGIRELILRNTNGSLDWKGGPLFFKLTNTNQDKALSSILNWLEDYAKEHSLKSISGSFSPFFPEENRGSIENLLIANGFEVHYWGTFIVDLENKSEEIWKSLKPAARKAVRKAERFEIKVRQINSLDELRHKFFEPYKEASMTGGRGMIPWRNFEIIWNLDQQKHYHFYVVEDEGEETLAMLGSYWFNGLATEILSGISPKAYEKKIPAQDFLHWNVILDAKSGGCRYFDLAGVEPEPSSSKAEGIKRFKEKWGGEYYPILRYSKTLKPGLFELIGKEKR